MQNGRSPADLPFLKTIREYRLIDEGRKVIVGFSGGADSACLLDLFLRYAKELKIQVAACHVNHLLRGKDSFRDETFAREFCAGRKAEFVCRRVDVKTYAKKNKLSLETAARECRYRALDEAAIETGSDLIATAHHAGDLAETLLFRMFKGTGVSGLASIPVRRGNIIRPLLYIPKKIILENVKKRKLPFVKDLSNDDVRFDRNYIRKKVVPVIEARFPGFADKAAELARIAADEEKFWEERTAVLDRYVKAGENGWTLDKKVFGDGVPDALIRRKVRGLLRDCGGKAYIGRDLIGKVMGSGKDIRGNKTLFRAKGLRVLSSYNNLCFLKEGKKFHKQAKHVKLKDKIKVPYGGIFLTFSPAGVGLPDAERDRMVFASDGIAYVTVRGRADGDRFKIGGGKTKKIKDHLIDNKVPLVDRERTVVIASPGGSVVAFYVPGKGFRVSEEFYVRAGAAKATRVKAETSER